MEYGGRSPAARQSDPSQTSPINQGGGIGRGLPFGHGSQTQSNGTAPLHSMYSSMPPNVSWYGGGPQGYAPQAPQGMEGNIPGLRPMGGKPGGGGPPNPMGGKPGRQ